MPGLLMWRRIPCIWAHNGRRFPTGSLRELTLSFLLVGRLPCLVAKDGLLPFRLGII